MLTGSSLAAEFSTCTGVRFLTRGPAGSIDWRSPWSTGTLQWLQILKLIYFVVWQIHYNRVSFITSLLTLSLITNPFPLPAPLHVISGLQWILYNTSKYSFIKLMWFRHHLLLQLCNSYSQSTGMHTALELVKTNWNKKVEYSLTVVHRVYLSSLWFLCNRVC